MPVDHLEPIVKRDIANMLFSRPHLRLIVVMLLLFATLVSAHLHGFSIPAWHRVLGDSTTPEVLAGRVQDIRSDDWQLDLPLVIAQAAHSPRFPLINTNVGGGQNALAPFRLPITHVILLFRPSTWGYYFGVDTGLSWMWWFLVFGVFYATFLTAMIVTAGDFALSVLAAAATVTAPIFLTWSFHKAEIPIHASTLGVCLYLLFFSRSPALIAASGIGVGLSLGGFFFHHVYPPIQVTVGSAFFLLFLYIFTTRNNERPKSHQALRWLALGLGASLFAFGLWSFWKDGSGHIKSIADTIYPGRRRNSGGGVFWETLFSAHFLPSFRLRDFIFFANASEVGLPMLFFPITIGALIPYLRKAPVKYKFLTSAIAGYLLLLIVYTYSGLPDWIARITFLNFSKGTRTSMAMAFCDLALLLILIQFRKSLSTTRERVFSISGLIIWLLCLSVTAAGLYSKVGEFGLTYMVFLLLINFGLAALLISKRHHAFFLCLAGLYIFENIGFNPLVRGGYSFIHDNDLSKAMRSLSKEYPNSRWVVMLREKPVGAISSLPRMIALPSFGGYVCPPPLSEFAALDSRQVGMPFYNQCGWLNFIANESKEVSFDTPSGGEMYIYVNPSHDGFKKLGYDLFLFAGGQLPDPIDLTRFTLRQELPHFRLYQRR